MIILKSPMITNLCHIFGHDRHILTFLGTRHDILICFREGHGGRGDLISHHKCDHNCAHISKGLFRRNCEGMLLVPS